MTIRLGTGELASIKLGSTAIDKAYLGSTVVWQPSTGTPNWDEYAVRDAQTFLFDGGPTDQYQLVAPPLGDIDRVRWSIASQGDTISTILGNITMQATTYNWALQGGFNELSPGYDYIAVYQPEANTGGSGSNTSPGWQVYVRETTPGAAAANRTTYVPLEQSTGFISGAASSDQGWGHAGSAATRTVASTFQFFDGYTLGDVASWTAP